MIGDVTLKTSSFSYSGIGEVEKEDYIFNLSTQVTIGGKVKQQSDTRRISFDLLLYVKQSDLASLMLVLEDYDTDLYIKTDRQILDLAADSFLEVVSSKIEVSQVIYNGEQIYTLRIALEEVI